MAKEDKWISEFVGIFCDPILVFPGGWGDSLPDWLKQAIKIERLMMNVQAIKTGEMTGTDAEAAAYLSTVSLTQPLDNDWTEIYLYVATKVYERWRTKDSGVTMPADIRVDKLIDYHVRKLNDLKRWLYARSVSMRLESDRIRRREDKESAAAAAKERLGEQVAFDFSKW